MKKEYHESWVNLDKPLSLSDIEEWNWNLYMKILRLHREKRPLTFDHDLARFQIVLNGETDLLYFLPILALRDSSATPGHFLHRGMTPSGLISYAATRSIFSYLHWFYAQDKWTLAPLQHSPSGDKKELMGWLIGSGHETEDGIVPALLENYGCLSPTTKEDT